jgi:hypothetical protein
MALLVVTMPFLSGGSLWFLTTTLFTEATPMAYKVGVPVGLVAALLGLLVWVRWSRRRASGEGD